MQEISQQKSQIKRRISIVLKKKNVSDYQFYLSSGVTRGVLSQDNGISEENLMRFLAYCPDVNPSWLLTGDGDMLLRDDTVPRNRQEVQLVHHSKSAERTIDNQCIPVYTGEVRAGVLSTLSNAEIIGDEWIHIPDMPKCDGAIRVAGTSMMPLLHPGDLIGISRVEPNIILWGQIYLVDFSVDGDEYIVVKRLCRSDEGKDYVTLVSDNPEYEPTDIPKHAIRGMAIVKFFIRQLTSM